MDFCYRNLFFGSMNYAKVAGEEIFIQGKGESSKLPHQKKKKRSLERLHLVRTPLTQRDPIKQKRLFSSLFKYSLARAWKS